MKVSRHSHDRSVRSTAELILSVPIAVCRVWRRRRRRDRLVPVAAGPQGEQEGGPIARVAPHDQEQEDPRGAHQDEGQSVSTKRPICLHADVRLCAWTRQVSHEDLSLLSTSLEDTLATAQAELERQKTLNEKLENDLLSVNKHNGSASSSAPAAEKAPGAAPGGLAGLDLGGKAPTVRASTPHQVTAYLRLTKHVSVLSAQESGRSSPIPFSAPTPDTSILPIVTSQRDRFRARNAELEEVRPTGLSDIMPSQSDHLPLSRLQELRKQFESISELRSEVKSLQSDNLKLYEKVRYIGSYRPDDKSSSSHAGPSNSRDNGSSLSGIGLASGSGGRQGGEEIGKYKDKYDESLNPFEAFKGRVSRLFNLLRKPSTDI